MQLIQSDRTFRQFLARPAVIQLATQHSIDPADLSDLSVPDSQQCREIEQLCRDVYSETLANHCLRSYAWGLLLNRAQRLAWDPERYYAAALLHDIGLTPTFDRGGCFESDGAAAARKILADLGWDEEDRDCIAGAIYLHMHEVSTRDSGEARLLAAGTSADVSGRQALEVPKPARSLILEMFPRDGFKREMLALFETQASRKPRCIVARYLSEGLGERILNAPYDE